MACSAEKSVRGQEVVQRCGAQGGIGGEGREVEVSGCGGSWVQGDVPASGVGLVCRCRMHQRPQLGVPDGVGCWKIAVGNHAAVRAAASGQTRVCAVREDVRAKDAKFYSLCVRPKWNGPMAYESALAFTRAYNRFATGGGNIEDFGRGYCHLLSLRKGYENRVARVFGPNMYVEMLMRVLCVAGKDAMIPLSVTEVAKGFLHVECVPGQGVVQGAGKQFYAELARYVRQDPYVRIGASVSMPREINVPRIVGRICFGDMVFGTHVVSIDGTGGVWEDESVQEVLIQVREYMGDVMAVKLHQLLVKCVSGGGRDEGHYRRNVRNRKNKKLAKLQRRVALEECGV